MAPSNKYFSKKLTLKILLLKANFGFQREILGHFLPVKVLNIKVFKLCNQFELSYQAHANKALNGVTKLRVLNSEKKTFLLSNIFVYKFSKTK